MPRSARISTSSRSCSVSSSRSALGEHAGDVARQLAATSATGPARSRWNQLGAGGPRRRRLGRPFRRGRLSRRRSLLWASGAASPAALEAARSLSRSPRSVQRAEAASSGARRRRSKRSTGGGSFARTGCAGVGLAPISGRPFIERERRAGRRRLVTLLVRRRRRPS